MAIRERKFSWQLDPGIERGNRWGEKTVPIVGTIDGKGGQSFYQYIPFPLGHYFGRAR